MCTTRISLGLKINAGVSLTSSRRLIFGGPEIALGLTGKILYTVMRVLAKREFIDRNRDVLMNAPVPSYTLSGRIGRWLPRMLKVAGLIPARGCTDLYYALGAQGVLPMRVGGATSQLDLPSLTPLSVTGCGRLQLGAPHWVSSVDYCSS